MKDIDQKIRQMRRAEHIKELRAAISRLPVVGALIRRTREIRHPSQSSAPKPFPGTAEWWEHHYAQGGNSGRGSYGREAKSKAVILNAFVRDHGIKSVIDFGCGDGNYLSNIEFPRYLGLDVSKTAVEFCTERYRNDTSKRFVLYDPFTTDIEGEEFRAELALSLDVIFHLIEDELFERYLTQLFGASTRYVVVRSSENDDHPDSHVKHRNFPAWVLANLPEWQLSEKILPEQQLASRYPVFIYERIQGKSSSSA